jgi:hypothetical protein
MERRDTMMVCMPTQRLGLPPLFIKISPYDIRQVVLPLAFTFHSNTGFPAGTGQFLESLRKRELTNQHNSIPEFKKLVADNP